MPGDGVASAEVLTDEGTGGTVVLILVGIAPGPPGIDDMAGNDEGGANDVVDDGDGVAAEDGVTVGFCAFAANFRAILSFRSSAAVLAGLAVIFASSKHLFLSFAKLLLGSVLDESGFDALIVVDALSLTLACDSDGNVAPVDGFAGPDERARCSLGLSETDVDLGGSVSSPKSLNRDLTTLSLNPSST